MQSLSLDLFNEINLLKFIALVSLFLFWHLGHFILQGK